MEKLEQKLLETNLVIGERIRIIREDLGYTRETFAESLEVSPSTLANVELGRTQVSQIILLNLYGIFGVSSDDILHVTKKSDTIQKKINRIVSNLNKSNTKYLYKAISKYVAYHK